MALYRVRCQTFPLTENPDPNLETEERTLWYGMIPHEYKEFIGIQEMVSKVGGIRVQQVRWFETHKPGPVVNKKRQPGVWVSIKDPRK